MSTRQTIINAWCNADFRTRYLQCHAHEATVQHLIELDYQETQRVLDFLFAPLAVMTGADYTQYTQEDLADD